MVNCKDEIADFTVSKDGGAYSNMLGQVETYRNSHMTRELTDDERIDIAAAHVLSKYKTAFEELAK